MFNIVKGVFCLFIFFPMALFCQIDAKMIDKELNKIYNKSTFPGLAVGVIKKDSVFFAKSYGWANVKNKIPFNERTIIPIASVSKTFIGFSLMKAIELGYLDAETSINEILPYAVSNPYFPDDTIRVKHLFTHTSGIIDEYETYISAYQIGEKPDMDLGVFLKKYLWKKGHLYSKNNFDSVRVGKKFNYSNIASALAAYLIELKCGISFDEFTQKYLFEPLGLHDSHWFYDKEKSVRYASLYDVDIPEVPLYVSLLNNDMSLKTYSCVTYPDGSLKSSLNDLLIYISNMISGYHHGSALMDKEYYKDLFSLQFTDHLPEGITGSQINQAVFWSYNRKNRFYHTGSDPGIYTTVSVDFESGIGRVILINTNIDIVQNKTFTKSIRKIVSLLDQVK